MVGRGAPHPPLGVTAINDEGRRARRKKSIAGLGLKLLSKLKYIEIYLL